jgi:carbonic anhydrase
MEEKLISYGRLLARVGLIGLVCGSPWVQASEAKPKTAAPASASPSASGEESLDVLRQRLAERLSSKADGAVPPLKVNSSGAREDGSKSAKGSSHKAGKKTEPPAHAAAEHPHWGYVGEGAPERWAELSPENRQCAIGTRQSPIDIREGIRVDLEKINFDYRPSGFSVLDNGHTIQVNVAPGNALQVMGRRFELLQFHFHRPSEERINGRQYDMDAHLVHKDADGKLAVVAVLLERGRDQPLIQTIWNNLPLEKGQALTAPGLLDLNQLLPEDRSYFTYMGSLTTPPCSEGVLWMVMRMPVQMSANQISIFSRLYPMNARPIQAGSGRLIKESSGGL